LTMHAHSRPPPLPFIGKSPPNPGGILRLIVAAERKLATWRPTAMLFGIPVAEKLLPALRGPNVE
jgi:hypothetical protein